MGQSRLPTADLYSSSTSAWHLPVWFVLNCDGKEVREEGVEDGKCLRHPVTSSKCVYTVYILRLILSRITQNGQRHGRLWGEEGLRLVFDLSEPYAYHAKA